MTLYFLLRIISCFDINLYRTCTDQGTAELASNHPYHHIQTCMFNYKSKMLKMTILTTFVKYVPIAFANNYIVFYYFIKCNDN